MTVLSGGLVMIKRLRIDNDRWDDFAEMEEHPKGDYIDIDDIEKYICDEIKKTGDWGSYNLGRMSILKNLLTELNLPLAPTPK